MIGNAIFGVPAELSTFTPRLPLVVIGLVGAGFVASLARACARHMSDEERKALSWLVPAALLAVLPALGGFPGARVLLLPNLGVAVLLATVIRHGLRGPLLVRAGAGLLAIFHLVLPGLIDVFNASYNAGVARQLESISASAAIGPGRPRVFVIGTSDPMINMYVPAVLDATTPERLSGWSVLSASKRDHRLTRVGPQELVLRPTTGSLLRDPFETLYRSSDVPFHAGDEVTQCGARFRVSAVEDGRPTEVHILFDRPLEDPSLRFLAWKNGELVALAMPAEGASVDIAWSAGPLGVF